MNLIVSFRKASLVKSRDSGFSLIELMVVVAIVGILAAIAYPSYTEYVIRGKIPEATSGLSEIRLKAEQYFADNRTYVGFTSPDLTGKYKDFTFAVSNLTATTYTLTATGNGGMSGFSYTVNQSNTRGSSSSHWGNSSTTCWILRKDGSC